MNWDYLDRVFAPGRIIAATIILVILISAGLWYSATTESPTPETPTKMFINDCINRGGVATMATSGVHCNK